MSATSVTEADDDEDEPPEEELPLPVAAEPVAEAVLEEAVELWWERAATALPLTSGKEGAAETVAAIKAEARRENFILRVGKRGWGCRSLQLEKVAKRCVRKRMEL